MRPIVRFLRSKTFGEKVVKGGHNYDAIKVIIDPSTKLADIYFKDGTIAKNVSSNDFEPHSVQVIIKPKEDAKSGLSNETKVVENKTGFGETRPQTPPVVPKTEV